MIYHSTNAKDAIEAKGEFIAYPIKKWTEGSFTEGMINSCGVSFTTVCRSYSKLGSYFYEVSLRKLCTGASIWRERVIREKNGTYYYDFVVVPSNTKVHKDFKTKLVSLDFDTLLKKIKNFNEKYPSKAWCTIYYMSNLSIDTGKWQKTMEQDLLDALLEDTASDKSKDSDSE